MTAKIIDYKTGIAIQYIIGTLHPRYLLQSSETDGNISKCIRGMQVMRRICNLPKTRMRMRENILNIE
jgi:hypothetical protein